MKVSNPGILNEKGPKILAANHPNSFLDAIILGAMFNEPVHYLVRGDVFKKPLIRKIFSAFKMMPIYRLSEGRENLSNNDETFQRCSEILKKDGLVLIFSEGLCKHEWALRPLKKGTARIALQAFHTKEIGDKIAIIPLCLNYSSFQSIGKNVYINFGEVLQVKNQKETALSGSSILEFNHRLEDQLLKVIRDQQSTKDAFAPMPVLKKTLLLLPAIIGYILSAPLYFLNKRIAVKFNKGGVFYDSMLFGFCMFLFPLYLLALCSLFNSLFHTNLGWWLILIAPLSAACTTRVFGRD